jgi:hypothetical protein
MYLFDIKHDPHIHPNGSAHKTIRVYTRKKVNGFYNYVPVGLMGLNCYYVDPIATKP